MQREGMPLVSPDRFAFGSEGAGEAQLPDSFHHKHNCPNADKDVAIGRGVRVTEKNAEQNGEDHHDRQGGQMKRAERLGFFHMGL